jgi:hypothetical protein
LTTPQEPGLVCYDTEGVILPFDVLGEPGITPHAELSVFSRHDRSTPLIQIAPLYVGADIAVVAFEDRQ